MKLTVKGEDYVLVPDYVSVVGSALEEDTPEDVDVLVRDQPESIETGWRESVLLLVRKVLDPLKKLGLKFHFLANPQGPHLAPGQKFMPIFDLVLRLKRRVAKAASEMPNWEDWLEEAPEGERVDLGDVNTPEGFTPLGGEANLKETWPLSSDSVSVVRANHVLEHLSSPSHAMREIWRVLKPGGLVILTVPHAESPGALHPDHMSQWNESTIWCFTKRGAQLLDEPLPGFELLKLERRGDYLDAVLKKPEEVEKKEFKPIAHFVPPKPSMKMRAHTDAFTIEELRPWLEDHLEKGVVAEPKLNGFRAVLQKAGDKISVFFEDSQVERYPVLSRYLDLKGLPDCIIDCDVGVREAGRRWPRIRIMTLLAQEPELGDAEIEITAFDLVYWDGEDLHDRPFAERRAKLEEIKDRLSKVGIRITPQMRIKSEEDLKRAWESKEFGSAPMSEGLVLKDLQWTYTERETSGMAKIKHKLEVKAKVIGREKNKAGLWVYECSLRDGEPIGKTLATEIEASEGDVVTAEVEEVIWDRSKDSISWMGAKVLDVDKERKGGYAKGQVLDMAQRARVLAVVPRIEKAETQNEDALLNWEKEWQEAIPVSGKKLRYVVHAHFRGLSPEEAKMSLEDLLHTGNSIHFDLRLESDRFGGFWGWSLFAGEARENVPTLRLARLDEGDTLAGAPKQFGPISWLDVGKKGPLIVEPRGAGATSKAWAKFFLVDSGTYQVGMARVHAVELFFDGNVLKGRYLLQYAALTGERQWLFSKPDSETPYAVEHSLESVVSELKRKGQRFLFWPKDPQNLSRGLEYLVLKTWLAKSEERRYTLGIAYPASERDSHGDFATQEELELAAWRFLEKTQRGEASIGLMHDKSQAYAGKVVESYIYRGPTWTVAGEEVNPGDWLLGVIWSPRAWELIKAGVITGYSIQGLALKKEEHNG